MSKMHFHYIVPGDDFTRAGEASSSVKKKLKQLGYDPDATRRVAIAMYEGEINMVIHAGGGEIDVDAVSYTHLHCAGLDDAASRRSGGMS